MAAQPPKPRQQSNLPASLTSKDRPGYVMIRKLRSVLLVDDDESSHYMTSIVLRQKGITEHIHFAESADKALRYLQLQLTNRLPVPELILVDIEMPDMTGLEFVADVRKLKIKPMPVVAYLTGFLKKYEALKRSRQTVLSKPLTEDDLIALIRRRFPDHFAQGDADHYPLPGNPQTSGLTLF